MQTRSIEPTVLDPEAVAAFFARHPGTEAQTNATAKIAQEEFAEIESLTVEAARDPEEDAEWIRVTVTSRLGADAFAAAYRRYGDRWLAEVTGERRHLVRLRRRRA